MATKKSIAVVSTIATIIVATIAFAAGATVYPQTIPYFLCHRRVISVASSTAVTAMAITKTSACVFPGCRTTDSVSAVTGFPCGLVKGITIRTVAGLPRVASCVAAIHNLRTVHCGESTSLI